MSKGVSSSYYPKDNSSKISILAVSDTHSAHAKININPKSTADIFIHAGDLTSHGTQEQLADAIEWIASLPFPHKIVVAGNHDIGLDKDCDFRARLARKAGHYATADETDALIASMKDKGIHYLSPENPEAELSIRDHTVRVYGLPYTPEFFGPNAFQRNRKVDTWADLQSGLGSYDILISHGPPKGYCDQTRVGLRVGCEHFLAALKRIQPKLSLVGHIHEARGTETITWESGRSTELYNVAVMGWVYMSPPTTITLDLAGESRQAGLKARY
jgi:Icc-related predicted phosphoesterase